MRLRFLVVLALSLLLTGCALLPSIPPFSDPRQAEVAPTAPTAEVTPSHEVTPTPAGPSVIPVVMIMDASGSMKQADMSEDVTRMAAAREAAKQFVDGLPAGTPAGLVSYGDLRRRMLPRSRVAPTCQ